jgi:GMP synthase PP-ATPase subunit
MIYLHPFNGSDLGVRIFGDISKAIALLLPVKSAVRWAMPRFTNMLSLWVLSSFHQAH